MPVGCGTAGIAARVADDYSLNGYDDWFLPSKDELDELYLNRLVVGGFAGAYWSSSEVDGNFAWRQSFFDGVQNSNFKPAAEGVRAIRAF